MAIKIGIGIAAVIAVFLLVVATRPSKMHVERSTTIAAPPETVFGFVNDFHRWTEFSPYEKLDPELKRAYEGATAGPGAVYTWAGNNKVGEGRMTIEKSEKPSNIGIKLEFYKPFAAVNVATFTFARVPEGTKATWAMDADASFMSKAASLFMNMDELIGSDFARGLATLKGVAETQAKVEADAEAKKGDKAP